MLLANARVIEETGSMDVVQVGARVTIKEDDNEAEIYTIVGPAEAMILLSREGLRHQVQLDSARGRLRLRAETTTADSGCGIRRSAA